MRAAILARVSTDGQHVDTQLRQMRDQVASDGNNLLAEYVDDGVSGKTGNLGARRDLLRMIDDLRQQPRPWDVLYFFDFDRLARTDDLEEQARILGPLQRAGVELRTRNGQQPALNTMVGRLLAHLQLDMSADWLHKHRDRTKAGKERALAHGRKPQGPTPYGLGYDRATGAWTIDEPAAQVVREIYTRVAAGESCEQIARDLNSRAVPRPRSGRWCRERIWAMVRKRTYVGEWIADKRRNLTLRVPPIVAEAAWQAAEDALAAQGRHRGPRSARGALLEGMCRCGICGGPVIIQCQRRGKPAYYGCKNRLGHGRGGGCPLPWRKVPEVDEAAWAAITELLAQPTHLADILETQRAGSGIDTDATQREADEYERQLRELDRREADLASRFADGQLEAGAFDVALRKAREKRTMLKRSLQAARTELARAEAAVAQASVLISSLESLRDVWQHAEGEERREAVRLLVPRGHTLVLGPTGLSGDLWLSPGTVGEGAASVVSFGDGSNSERLADPVRVRFRVAW